MTTWTEQGLTLAPTGLVYRGQAAERRSDFSTPNPTWRGSVEELQTLTDDAPIILALTLQSKWGL